jgi:hypothetical protein
MGMDGHLGGRRSRHRLTVLPFVEVAMLFTQNIYYCSLICHMAIQRARWVSRLLNPNSEFEDDSKFRNLGLEMELPAAVSAHLDRIRREVDVSRASPAEQLA